jgi:hypothetical protein
MLSEGIRPCVSPFYRPKPSGIAQKLPVLYTCVANIVEDAWKVKMKWEILQIITLYF